MYLMDQIAETSKAIMDRGEDNHPIMAVYPMLNSELEGTPRYIFDEDTINTAVELTLGRPKVLLEAMKNLVIPYPKIWIEWPESGRRRLREVFTESEKAAQNKLRPLPDRIGFLIKTFQKRQGIIYWVWNTPPDPDMDFCPPNICPISAYFDLDGRTTQPQDLLRTFLTANLASLWKDNPTQLQALRDIWETGNHCPSKWGDIYLKQICGSNKNAWAMRLNHFYADVYGEYIMVWACMMLLTASKKVVEYHPTNLAKLNKTRIKQNKAPKYDYNWTTLYIPREKMEPHAPGAPLGYKRKSPRIHMVESFLNRRGDKHWVVQPFWRGKGEVISRHVHVKTKKEDKK